MPETFASLSFQQNGEVFRRLGSPTDPALGSIRFLAGKISGLVAFLAYSRPKVGWKISPLLRDGGRPRRRAGPQSRIR